MTAPTLPPLPEPHGHIADDAAGRIEFRWAPFTDAEALFRSTAPVFTEGDMRAYATTYGQACAEVARAELVAEVERLRADAARYRAVRRGQHWSVINGIGDILRADALDAAIDSAMKGESK